uniref:hypothetical protein n=1 Tax=Patulibacter defluvii TaxID=3095358 RepID=UPI002A75BE24
PAPPAATTPPSPPAAPPAGPPPAAGQAPPPAVAPLPRTRIDDGAPATQGDTTQGDVLSDTPDFLQETPDHDRLWFEQKPPKDFDF